MNSKNPGSKNPGSENTSSVQFHTAHIKEQLIGLIDHLRADIPKLSDPRAKALFEVSAEVLSGLNKAFTDYEEKQEPAWK